MAEGGKPREISSSAYELTDHLILKLSEHISSGDELDLLAVGVLKLELGLKAAAAAKHDEGTIHEAARKLLQKWRGKQNNRQEAFTQLEKSLRENEENLMADDLLRWAEEEQDPVLRRFPGWDSKRQVLFSDKLQREVKQALIDRFENFLKNDWLDDDDAKTMPLQNHYTQPEWKQIIKGGLQDTEAPLPGGLYQILEESQRRVRVIITGKPGSGKSSAVAKLALDWAQRGPVPRHQTGLNKINSMFVVTLRDVDSNDSLENIIIQQHNLNTKHRDQIRRTLQAPNTLIAFDGYDEYKKGTNSDIDAVISGQGKMSYIVTCRPGNYLEKKERKGLTEVQIVGLSLENIFFCVEQYLDNDSEKASKLVKKVYKANIYDLLATPILLLLVCVLFEETDGSLPQTKTEIVQEIVNMLIERSVVKRKLAPMEPKDKKNILEILGQLSWKASQKDTKQLYLDQSDVEQANADILNLGLLHGSMKPEKSSRHKQPKWLTYPHKLLQDFLAGLFAAKCTKEEVQAMFPCWEQIEKQFEVVKFMCGLRDDPSDVIDHICQQFVQERVEEMRFPRKIFLSISPLHEIARETKGKTLSVNPYCNDHITVLQKLPLRRQSQLYVFWTPEDKSIVDVACENETIVTSASPTCAVWIETIHSCHLDDVLIEVSSLNQTITDLYISVLNTPEFNGPVFKMDPEARSVASTFSRLSPSVQEDFGQQLSSCHKLQVLCLQSLSHVALKVVNNLGTKTNLVRLNLANCRLSEEQCLVLCRQLQFTHHLRCLNLTKNPLGSAGARLLAQAITSWGPNHSLQRLWLSDCELDAAGCVPLMKALPSCCQLEELHLPGNPMGGTFRDLGPEVIYPQLRILDVRDTSLLKDDIRNINIMISNQRMPRLDDLRLGCKKLMKKRHRLRQQKRYLSSREVFQLMLDSESDEMLQVWKRLVQKWKTLRWLILMFTSQRRNQ